jgi:uncharacterized protein YdhG (YjbR/CyaY superfamily)
MSVIDDYLHKQSSPQKEALMHVRAVIKQAIPEADEVISYGMPGFKIKGRYIIGFAPFKDHISIFPTPGPIEALKEKLTPYKISKGTVQFTPENPLPVTLIQDLVAARLELLKGEKKY